MRLNVVALSSSKTTTPSHCWIKLCFTVCAANYDDSIVLLRGYAVHVSEKLRLEGIYAALIKIAPHTDHSINFVKK